MKKNKSNKSIIEVKTQYENSFCSFRKSQIELNRCAMFMNNKEMQRRNRKGVIRLASTTDNRLITDFKMIAIAQDAITIIAFNNILFVFI